MHLRTDWAEKNSSHLVRVQARETPQRNQREYFWQLVWIDLQSPKASFEEAWQGASPVRSTHVRLRRWSILAPPLGDRRTQAEEGRKRILQMSLLARKSD